MRFSDTEIYVIESGTLTVIRVEDFEQIQYHLPQTFFNEGVFSLVHRGVIYATSSSRTEEDIFMIDSRALFTRDQFNLTAADLQIMRTVGDTVVAIGHNIHWFDMNTRKYGTWDLMVKKWSI